jgi:hypothetical protein
LKRAGSGSDEYENRIVRVVTIRKIPKTETPGIVIEESEAGKELILPLWAARELADAGLVKLVDEGLTADEWTQIHFRERLNPTGPLAPLPEGFFQRAYTSLSSSAREAAKDPARREQLNRVLARYRDILESRVGKIIRLASAEAPQTPKGLQPEEAQLYEDVQRTISGWRAEMRRVGEG